MKLISILGGAFVVLLPLGAIAQTPDDACPLRYDQYEVGVPHTDLDTCPVSMNAENVYCRLSLVAEIATVFAFSEETDCIVATRVYFDDAFTVSID